jgi:hypothetical protein
VLNHVQLTLSLLLCLTLSANRAVAQPNEVVREQTVRGTVEAVDHAARTVRVRGDRDNVVTLDIPQSIAQFDSVQVGDTVSVSYFDRVAVRLKAAGEPVVDRTDPPATTAAAGSLPGATVASQRVTTVTITSWDPDTRVVMFTGPTGAVYSRHLLDSTDATIMSSLKVGDRVDVTRTEAVRLSVEPHAAPAPLPVVATSGFRNRVTVAAFWGWDNSFSGNMIKAAAGQTTTGQPINLNQTTYDDVYGRMGMFKIGVGYRTTPRSEATVNFVLSNSSAQQVTIGTAGPANTPLNVDFDDINYWGFEGGQRFFFTRVRFTPYVGYLVGLNRYGDIRGTFAGVPTSATPGLAAQDGKFFEKSWAFSLGPTGGFLIGLGPVEFIAETQLRFMGGLSDVDWLVEEGLKDINTESSRWSFPVQIGARIRFK